MPKGKDDAYEATKLGAVAPKLKKLLPFGENVLVQPGELDTAIAFKKAGFVVPENMRDKPNNGRLISLGSGVRQELKDAFKNGSTNVLYTKYGGTPFDFQGTQLLVLSQDDIICGFEE